MTSVDASPLTPRGQATRRAVITGARTVFERDGFVDARIVDIAQASGVATGSFYTYFPDKASALAAVFEEMQEEMLHPQLSRGDGQALVVDGIAASNRIYLETYRANARLMALREQVAAIDESFREARRERARVFIGRNARFIVRLQAAGLADPALDPALSAASLSGMVSRAAHTAFVLGDEVPMDHLVDTLTRLWANALGIPDGAAALPGRESVSGGGGAAGPRAVAGLAADVAADAGAQEKR